MPDPSRGCDLPHSSWERQILNPLSATRDQTSILMDPSRVFNLLTHSGNNQDEEKDRDGWSRQRIVCMEGQRKEGLASLGNAPEFIPSWIVVFPLRTRS